LLLKRAGPDVEAKSSVLLPAGGLAGRWRPPGRRVVGFLARRLPPRPRVVDRLILTAGIMVDAVAIGARLRA
jgi:hypothetical protein